MDITIYEKIKQADMVLIGIGEELDHKSYRESLTAQKTEDAALQGFYESQYYCDKKNCDKKNCDKKNQEDTQDTTALRVYNKIAELVKGKPYFVISMCTDGEIYDSDLNPEQIVTPCGDIRKMQCDTHIVEAGPINHQVLQAQDPGLAVCPICQKPLAFHTIKADGYLEEGYLPQWEKYTKWLTYTLNTNLCVLELGVGFRYPQVIRWPFEKTVYYNKKACLIRVNETLCQLPEEIGTKGISVKSSIKDFMGV